jgi:hypothetical protein
MPKKPRWTETPGFHGAMDITFTSWRYFFDFINQRFLDYKGYIFRGQANEAWPLRSSLDRVLLERTGKPSREARQEHLRRFVLAARGRRGVSPPRIDAENEWWALGQHHGLATPLLDWTESPFVALYFAFVDLNDGGSKHRVVYGLHQSGVEARTLALKRPQKRGGRGRPPITEIVRPMSDENPRLVSQRGLFTRVPDGVTIDEWVRRNFPKQKSSAVLIRFRLPNKQRDTCLRFLNRMNINHLSLFPDLYGASRYCNQELTIDSY